MQAFLGMSLQLSKDCTRELPGTTCRCCEWKSSFAFTKFPTLWGSGLKNISNMRGLTPMALTWIWYVFLFPKQKNHRHFSYSQNGKASLTSFEPLAFVFLYQMFIFSPGDNLSFSIHGIAWCYILVILCGKGIITWCKLI